MARRFGLGWMVSTDHGGRDHARISLDNAYPDLLRSRAATPDLIQFFGIELNTPGGDHSTVIMPRSEDEAQRIYELERRYDSRERNHIVAERDTSQLMAEYLRLESRHARPPVVIANHPSKTVPLGGGPGRVSPAELRLWNDAAPLVAVGMEGAPGHQAASLSIEGDSRAAVPRATYAGDRTLGGYDPMTARLGNLWDAMLGEGRRWWITATSDSHRHRTEGGVDFWPGEYSKTYVYAAHTYEDVLHGLRYGRIFTVTGDLVSELFVKAKGPDGGEAGIGGTLRVPSGSAVSISVEVRDPGGLNHNGDSPDVRRIDVIAGDIHGRSADPASTGNTTTRVHSRFYPRDWTQDGERIRFALNVGPVITSTYIRIRGTNGPELEPEPDPPGENPWQDLWFYSNPIFIVVN